jgi:uncharacterized protein YbcI
MDQQSAARYDQEHHSEGPDSTLAGITREMVRLYKEQFGRGPTKARTAWAGPNTLITILEHTLTPAERNLTQLGEHQRVRDIRTFFQYATVPEFCAPVERLTGRNVRAFLSAIDTQVDGLATETFLLYPEAEDGASCTELARRVE